MKLTMITLSFALLAAACGGNDGTADATGAPEPGNLVGTSWEAVAVFVEGTSVAIVPGTRITMVFSEDGTGISGTTGCNGYFADVELGSDRITIARMGMTEMACDPPRMEQESVVFTILAGADRWSLGDGRLDVGASDGSGAIEFAAPLISDEDLAGTLWVLDAIIEGDTATTPLRDTEVTLRIDPARNALDGSTGCNEFSGEVEVAMPSFSVENIAWTDRACAPAVMDQEVLFLEVLQAAGAAEIEGDRLTLQAADGRGLVFRSREGS